MSSLQIGRLALGPPWQWHEGIGDPITNLGGAAIPAPRQAIRHLIDVATVPPDGATDTLLARYTIRRQLRSMFNNTPLKLQGFFYIQYSDDPEQNGWYLPDFGQLADIEGAAGLATGIWKLEQVAWIMAGHKRINREARNIWMKDLRAGQSWRDTLKLLYSTDFSALPSLQLTILPHGASSIANAVSGQTLVPVALPTGRDGGICQLVTGQADLSCLAFERAESAFNLSDVIVYDRRGNLGPFGSSGPAAGGSTTGTNTGATMTVTAPAGLSNGNLVIVAAAGTFGNITPPAGWTTLVNNGGGTASNNVFYKVANNEPASWAFSQPGGTWQWVCAIWTGVDTTAPVNASAFTANTNTSPTVTTTVGGCAILTIAGSYSSDNAGSFTYPAACTIQKQGIAVNSPVAVGYDTNNQVAAGVTTTRAVTNTNAATLLITTIALTPLLNASYDTAAGLSNPTSAYGWEEVYGPDYPWSWGGATPTLHDTPVLENGLVRVRYDDANNLGFRVDVWNGSAYVEQGKMVIQRLGDISGVCDTWISANLVEYTPDRAVILVLLANSADTNSRERVYITVQRGEIGVGFEIYPALKLAGTQADAILRWTPAPNSGVADLNQSVAKIDSQGSGSWTPGAAGTGVYAATAGTGAGPGNSGLFGALATLGSASFIASENWASILRSPTTYNVIGSYQHTLVVQQAANTVVKYSGTGSGAYGVTADTYQVISLNSAGYIQCQIQFGATVADQIMECETMTTGTNTTLPADAAASGGTTTSSTRTTDANPHVSRTTWPNGFLATYRVFARVKTTASTLNIYAKTGVTTGATVTTTSASYVWLDLGEITANNTTLEIHCWATAAATVSVDRIEAVLVQDRARTSAIYSGSRDAGQAALQDSRTLGAVVAR